MTMNLTKCLWCSITSSQLLLILGITKCQDTICIPPNLEPTVHQGICQLSLIFLQVRGVTPNIYNQYHSCFQNCPWLGMRWWGQRQPMRTDLSVGRRETHREPCLTKVIPPCPVSTCEVKTMLWVIHSKNFVISCFHPNHLLWVLPQCISPGSSCTRLCQEWIQFRTKPWPCSVHLPSWISAVKEHRITRDSLNHRALPLPVLQPVPSVSPLQSNTNL